MNPVRAAGLCLLTTVMLSTSMIGNAATAAFTNRSFECYVAAYAKDSQSQTLINPSLRVGLHPSGSGPAIHIYGSTLRVIPISAVRHSDRFLSATIVSAAQRDRELGRLLLRQRGLNLEFNLTADRRGSSEADENTVFVGECSSVGYQRS